MNKLKVCELTSVFKTKTQKTVAIVQVSHAYNTGGPT